MKATAPNKLTDLKNLQQAAECLRTLAHPVRLRMVQMMLQGEFTVGDLAEACLIPSHMASEHLRMMQHCGFLTRRQEGRRNVLPSGRARRGTNHGMHRKSIRRRLLVAKFFWKICRHVASGLYVKSQPICPRRCQDHEVRMDETLLAGHRDRYGGHGRSCLLFPHLSAGGLVKAQRRWSDLYPQEFKGETMSTIQSPRKIEHVQVSNFNEKVLQFGRSGVGRFLCRVVRPVPGVCAGAGRVGPRNPRCEDRQGERGPEPRTGRPVSD